MSNLDTFEGSTPIETSMMDPLYTHQKKGVDKMRASLLSCSEDPVTAKRAINDITAMRVYHQICRIIKYLDLMDKLEDKMYSALEYTINKAPIESNSTWMLLMNAQEKLQKMMIESHKLLQPYLDIQEFSIMELTEHSEDSNASPLTLDQESRDKVRNVAMNVLAELAG